MKNEDVPGGSAGWGSSIVTAVAEVTAAVQVLTLAWEFPCTTGWGWGGGDKTEKQFSSIKKPCGMFFAKRQFLGPTPEILIQHIWVDLQF